MTSTKIRLVGILRLCSLLITVYSVSMLMPIGVAFIYDEPDLWAFLLTFCAALASGLFGIYATKRHTNIKNLQDRDGFLVAVLFWLVFSYRSGMFDGASSITHGFFQAVSVFTDNGLGTANFPAWPQHIVLLLLGASFFGGCVGSTCGGIKAMRFLVLYRQSSREVDQLIHSRAVYSTTIGGFPIPDRVTRSVWSLFFFYIFFTCMFVWALVIMGRDLHTAFGTVAACINNMGIGYGDTAAGFGVLSPAEKWLMSAAMLFGRLEIFPILVVCSRTFWKF